MPQEKESGNIVNNYFNASTRDPEYADENTAKCPKCGKAKITFKRERIGTVTQSVSRKKHIGSNKRGHAVSQTAYRTVGVCQNCGFTWEPDVNKSSKKSGRKTWLWVLGWICIFPIPLTILLLRKKEMKPAVKYGIIAAAWILYLIIGIAGNSETESPQSEEPTSSIIVQEEQTTSELVEDADQNVQINETVTAESNLNSYVNEIVTEFNEKQTEELIFVEDFTPSDKESSHYRTEFRLAAYEDAIGKSYLMDDKVVDIVVSQTIFNDINCRVYTNDTSLEQVILLLQGFSPILDNSLTADEVQKAVNEVSEKKYANAYYFGDLGFTLFGSDSVGFELMLKND